MILVVLLQGSRSLLPELVRERVFGQMFISRVSRHTCMFLRRYLTVLFYFFIHRTNCIFW